jgi:transketolase
MKAFQGVRIASGSLGQGLSVSIGAALAKKINNDPNIVYTLVGDGELQEGQNWEALMFAAGNKVDNIIATVDLNGKQIDGSYRRCSSYGKIKNKFEAFGWEVIELKEGNSIPHILKALQIAKSKLGNGKPIVVLMKTEMGNGVDFMMHTHAWHGKAPNNETTRKCTFAKYRDPRRLLKMINKMTDYINQGSKDTRSGFGAGLAELRKNKP